MDYPDLAEGGFATRSHVTIDCEVGCSVEQLRLWLRHKKSSLLSVTQRTQSAMRSCKDANEMKHSARVAGLALLASVGMFDLPGIASNQAVAQMNWLTPHLESQRHHNIRRHQQRLHEKRLQRQEAVQDQSSPPPVSPRPDPVRSQRLMRQIEPEYHRRVQLYGKASADDWLRRTAWQLGVDEGRRARQRAENQ